MTERLFTLDEVADILGVSIATVKRRIRSGALPVFRDGRIVRVRERDLRAYIASHVDSVGELAPPVRRPAGHIRRPRRHAASGGRVVRLWDA